MQRETKVCLFKVINIFFNINNWDFGNILKDTDIIKVLSSVKQIKGFDITFIDTTKGESGQVITPKYFEIIQPDNINISFVYE